MGPLGGYGLSAGLGQVHHCPSGTPPMTIGMCIPHPAQVTPAVYVADLISGFLSARDGDGVQQVEHFVFIHIVGHVGGGCA